MLTLHLYHMSPFNEKITRMLNFKGVPYEEKYWRIADRGKVMKINPIGKLPALEHNGHWVCDSTDMAHYIETAFPEKPLIPAEPKLRGQLHVLEDWADESLYFYEMRLRFTTPGNQQRNIPRMVAAEAPALRWLMQRLIPKAIMKITKSQGIGRKSMEQILLDTRRHVQAVADMLGDEDWLLGNRLTLADLAVYAMFQCFRDADMAMAMMEEHPAIMAWMARIEASTSEPAQG